MVEELTPSELGTKSYWEGCYEKEIENFENDGDVGEVWFGEEAAVRVVNWLNDREQEGELSLEARILDVGCGNGMMSVDLFNEGWKNVTGVDYSPAAIELAKKVSQEEGCDVEFEVCDILEDSETASSETMKKIFDIVVDKGTYDAISLGENAAKDRLTYIRNIDKVSNVNLI